MLFLASTSDKIQVITSAAGQVDVWASYVDLASGAVSAGRQVTRINTATTTDVVAAPAASTTRNVKNLKVGNNHASVTNTVTIQVTDGTNTFAVEQLSLAPGERLGYEEGVGIRVFDAAGREKVATGSGVFGNSNTSDVVASAADTYLTGSSLPIGGRVQAGSFFLWRMRCTKTAAGTATPAFNIRLGTAGSTADTARVTLTSTAAGTAATDTGVFEIDGRFESGGASAVLEAWIRMDHSSADGAGLGTFRYITTQSASFDVTPAGTIIGVSCNPGATGTPVWTFQSIIVEAGNLIS